MSAPARLDPAREFWMTAPATAAVMDAISPGDSDRARFVGGAVRDALAGRTVEDIDIATTLGHAPSFATPSTTDRFSPSAPALNPPLRC